MDNNCLDWNATINDDGLEFKVLDEGEYDFEVKNFERGHFPGGAKIPACNKAILTLDVEGVTIKCDLLLYKSVEWKISSFFRSIGAKKSGEALVMNWNTIIGKRGRCKIKQKSYVNQYGDTKVINEVDRFLDYKEPVLVDVDDEDLPF